MAKRKTEFKLMTHSSNPMGVRESGFVLKIIEGEKPSVGVDFGTHQVYEITGKDMEELGVAILKALKSKHLKHGTTNNRKN